MANLNKKTIAVVLIAMLFAILAYSTPQILNIFNNNTYTNYSNGSGGGVSFNGSPVDLNGSKLYNGSFDNINETLNLKVNKSGDNMTGTLFFNITNNNSIVINMSSNNRDSGVLLPNGNSFYNFYENSTLRTSMGVAGKQYWNVDNTGYIIFTTPGGNPGIIYLSSNYPNTPYYRQESYMSTTGYTTRSQYFNPTSSTSNTTKLDIYGGFTISNLSGSGNAYVCVDSNGKLYRSSVCS